jgi:8-oxo-dGTP diphosphatase
MAISAQPTQPKRDLPSGGGAFLVDVRVVLITVNAGQLLVALLPDGDTWQLPRGYPFANIPLDAAARTITFESTELHEQYLEQLYTLSVRDGEPCRIVVSYLALVASTADTPPATSATWREVKSTPLPDVDQMVLDYAIVRLRAKLGYTTIAFHLMPETFSLSELQAVYETAIGIALDKRNFRRRIIASGMLEPTSEKRRDGSHRPAQLYRFRAGHDPAAFLTPQWAGEA